MDTPALRIRGGGRPLTLDARRVLIVVAERHGFAQLAHRAPRLARLRGQRRTELVRVAQ